MGTRLLGLGTRLLLAAVLSMPGALATAHEIEPTVADVAVGADAVEVRLRTAAEALIAGIDLGAVADTDEAPEAERHDALRRLEPAALEAALRESWPAIREDFVLLAGDAALEPELEAVEIPEVGDPELRRDSVLVLRAPLPADGSGVRMGLAPDRGALIVRQGDGEASYEAFLSGGDLTDPMPRDAVAAQNAAQVFGQYLWQGVLHIVPMGLDHILFVLGLFFYALAWRPLLWQVTSFTAAHTVTLALATVGIVRIPGTSMWIVESIIAASIVYVAVENLVAIRRARRVPAAAAAGGPVTEGGVETPRIGWDRIAVVFAFGLLHGLGFASVFSELDVSGNLAVKLIGFNVGVELGQLLVIAVAFAFILAAFRVMGRRLSPVAEGFHAVAVVGSLLIAAQGVWWVIERTILG
ncbi:HupE/UreJ family protein [Jannaschia sp. W003]|uniref:HupE/UreJ family protein n=1 Tax=Jannaschia sp. W003 TaxID=2867012 RepID=UPI0021A82A38|nr:HupE/UreJ family protein [Jannaschia sp. W003]UWQ21877.1 HupE/UreJ family protein [Jannaschia sp. W003]